MRNTIPVFKPSLGEPEITALEEIFKTGWIGMGPKTTEFENNFASYVGAEYAIGVNSATAALHLSCLALGIGAGDEVLVPTVTFVSTAHAVSYCGAVPVFVDVEADTLNIDTKDLERKVTSKTRAIIPVHYGGHACRMDKIWKIAAKHGLKVIEDAAHACGSRYENQLIGGLEQSALTCFSFHAVKNLATGDGGMITTNRSDIANKLNRLRWVGINRSTWERADYSNYDWYYEIHELGYKYHMNDITAAIGLVQLDKLEAANKRRREIAAKYTEALKSVSWIDCPVERDYTKSACHNYVIKTPYRNSLNLYLKAKGISTGVHYMPLHLQPYYRKLSTAELPNAEDLWLKLLTLPLYPDLTDKEVAYIIESVLSFRKCKDE